MTSYLKNILDALKRSLWFIPFLMSLMGLFLAISLNYLDSALWDLNIPYFGEAWGVNSDGANSLFASVGAAIITSMTTILSITLLIFTVLAGQYGSHVLRIFKIRTFSKFVIGWFSGVYIYIIYHVYTLTINGENYVPQLSLTIGIILTITTIFLIILYIHFLVRQIQVGTVVSEVSSELRSWVLSLDLWEADNNEEEKLFLPERTGDTAQLFAIDPYGYVQSIDKEKLQELALENNFTIQTKHRPGDFIVTQETAFIVYAESKVEEEVVEKIKSCWILGEKRIPVEDLEFNLEILLEMTFRALSPGVNDVVIANNCIDYLGESIALLVKRSFPKDRVHSEDGKLLLITKEFSFEGFMNSALNPIRQYSTSHCSVTIRLLDSLIKAAKLNRSPSYHAIIHTHFMAIYDTGIEQHKHNLDQTSIKKRLPTFLNCSAPQEMHH